MLQKKWFKITLVVFIVLLIVTGLYYMFKGSPFRDIADVISSDKFPLKRGKTEPEIVKEIQTKLGIPADGIWGDQTDAALMNKIGKTELSRSDFKNL